MIDQSLRLYMVLACLDPGQAEGAEEDLFFAREAGGGRLPKYVELLKFKVRLHAAY